jgi:hypothetical protein
LTEAAQLLIGLGCCSHTFSSSTTQTGYLLDLMAAEVPSRITPLLKSNHPAAAVEYGRYCGLHFPPAFREPANTSSDSITAGACNVARSNLLSVA